MDEKQTCSNCNRIFSWEKDYRYHKKDCQPDTCRECGQCFPNQHALKTHIAKVHTQTFKCGTCNKNFANKRNLKRHEVVHTDSKIQCEMCNSKFSTKSSMQRHMKQQH